jgi:hemolysin activation/secretion protein
LNAPLRILFGAAILLTAGITGLHGQDFEQIAPRLPSESPIVAPQEIVPEPDKAVIKLEGILFLDSFKNFSESGLEPFKGIQSRGVAIAENQEFQKQIEPYLNQQLSRRWAELLLREIILAAQMAGKPAMFAVVPDQPVINGTLQIILIEGRLPTAGLARDASLTNEDLFAKLESALTKTGAQQGMKLEDFYWNHLRIGLVEPKESSPSENAGTPESASDMGGALEPMEDLAAGQELDFDENGAAIKTGMQAVLAPQLKSLIFLKDPKSVEMGGLEERGGIHARGIPFLQIVPFQRLMQPYLDREVTLELLDVLIRDVVIHAHMQGRHDVYVVLPEQDLSNGVVQIVVLQGNLGKATPARDQDWLENEELFSQLQKPSKTPVHREQLEDFYWLNMSPIRVLDPKEKILVKRLKGLVFVAKQEAVSTTPPVTPGIQSPGIPILQQPAFRIKAERFLGKPINLRILNRISRDTILHYRENDRPIVDAFIPEQDITGGVVQVVVTEGRLGEIKTEGNDWFASDYFKKQISMKTGDPISAKRLNQDLAWINSNPFRQTAAVFTPGKEKGQTDLVLKTKDQLPVRVYTGFDDSGNDSTGDERVVFGANWGDAFGLDHLLSYQFTSDLDFSKLTAHSGSYMIPLPWRHRLTVLGSYAETVGDLANQSFDLKGLSWQASMRYAVPLPAVGNYSHQSSLGFDLKRSNNNLAFGGTQVFDKTTEIIQWIFEYSSSFPDPWGGTTFTGALTFSPGEWTQQNSTEFFELSRTGAKSQYKYGKLGLERLTRLPRDFTWIIKTSYQVSDGNLLGSEQFGLGGFSTVRGYEEREANGDMGYFVSTEIRTFPFSFGPITGFASKDKSKDQCQLLAFFDYGATENHTLLAGEDPHIQLASAGTGVRYAISPWVSVRFDYGWQLMDTSLNARYNQRGHMGFMVSY